MTIPAFLRVFLPTLAIAVLMTLLLLQWQPLQGTEDFAVISLVFFVALTVAIYYAGLWSAGHANKMIFSYFSMLVVMAKIIAAIGLMVVYQQLVKPPTKNFVVLLGAHYLIFTVAEVIILMRLAKMK